MTNQQKNGIVCIVLALILAGIAIKSTFFSDAATVGDASSLNVGRVVGSFLPSVVVLAVGLRFLQKPKTLG